ncbi:ImmA/IrrE family metallo-endopeptidase [uncultured Paracoccus sp.]|uniref:ImmA/IrrE family metallo-endopeptidase n=1 Tax=uncultured Paracoccus sp. TaxID=189685 RepID=UPI0030D72471|tara:strand:- start:4547 stop:5086 length:540 start_codon:yes stop_codon:yes gene_type:complete
MTHGTDFIVPARRWAEIGRIADNLRSQLGQANTPRVPVIEIIERVLDQRLGLVRFEVGSREEMGRAEGYTCPKGEFIMLREDVYEGVWAGEGRARFTTAHELGHWAMHTNMPLARAKHGDGTPKYRLAEPQANQFAAEFLMPECFINAHDEEHDLIERFGVSREAAQNRLRYLHRNGRF